MLNWLKAQTARRTAGQRSSRTAADESFEEAMAACPPQASSQLMSAIRSAASALGSEPWHGPLRHHRGRIIVILARQLADANKRLGSSYWTGPDGHNVGLDVFKAYVEAGPKIILTDAIMVASSIGIAASLKEIDYHYTGFLSLVTLYSLSYILFTNIR
jgi:hypothetical protein